MPQDATKVNEQEREWVQYKRWGVRVDTSNVRPVHLADGLVQLLRLADTQITIPPPGRTFLDEYYANVKAELRTRGFFGLNPNAQALAVMSSKRLGPLSLAARVEKEPKYLDSGRRYFADRLKVDGGGPLDVKRQALLKGVINADGKVMESGAADPTTPGLLFAGWTETHTIRGMHAATFLGLLGRTERGREVLAALYGLLASEEDPHSKLVRALGLGMNATWPRTMEPSAFAGKYPLPEDPEEGWTELAEKAGQLTQNLLAWCSLGISKADTLMAVTDLAAFLLSLRMLRSSPIGESRKPSKGRLILLLSPQQTTGALRTAISRAQQSLQVAAATLSRGDREARRASNVMAVAKEEDTYALSRDESIDSSDSKRAYPPALHALNLGAAGGWLYPLQPQGGAKRYMRPGARQFTTLVHALIPPKQERVWSAFAGDAEGLGLAIGGPDEHRVELALGIGPVSETLRRIGKANQEHLIALGLARRESDNVIVVDGGAQ